MNGREPLRGPHSNLAPPKDRRPIGDVRNGSGVAPAAAGMSRAEKFEDEKRRVMQSCFEKQDLDGSGAFSLLILAWDDQTSSQQLHPLCSTLLSKKLNGIRISPWNNYNFRFV